MDTLNTDFDKKITLIPEIYQRVSDYILGINDERIKLLRIPEVIMWIYGELSFLSPIEKINKTQDTHKLKKLEDCWGQKTLKILRPDLKLDKQWTGRFGEHICEEIYILIGKNSFKPITKNNYKPDIEIDDSIIECKTQTYHTKGTAGEKILGSPFKYAEIPHLYGKKLIILCIGGAENVCRKQYGNLNGSKCSSHKQEFITFFKSKQIEFIGATDILNELIKN